MRSYWQVDENERDAVAQLQDSSSSEDTRRRGSPSGRRNHHRRSSPTRSHRRDRDSDRGDSQSDGGDGDGTREAASKAEKPDAEHSSPDVEAVLAIISKALLAARHAFAGIKQLSLIHI